MNPDLIIHYEGYRQVANYFKSMEIYGWYYIGDEYISPGYSSDLIPLLFIDDREIYNDIEGFELLR